MPHRSDVYEKVAFDAKNHHLFSNVRYYQYPPGRRRKRMKESDYSYFFTHNTTGTGRIVNRRKRGDPSHRNVTFSYTSPRSGRDIPIIDCEQSFKKFGGVW